MVKKGRSALRSRYRSTPLESIISTDLFFFYAARFSLRSLTQLLTKGATNQALPKYVFIGTYSVITRTERQTKKHFDTHHANVSFFTRAVFPTCYTTDIFFQAKSTRRAKKRLEREKKVDSG